MKNIGLVYMATSVYKNYFENFLESLKFLFPEDNKTLIVISDGLQEFNEKTINGVKIYVKDVVDLPYPFLPCCKFRFVTRYTKEFNFDYIMNFDSDTIILEKPIEFWNKLKDKLETGKLLMTQHPHYLYTPDRHFYEPFIVSNPDSIGYIDAAYINDRHSYIMTSFFAGKYDIIKYFDNQIYYMLGRDMDNLRWIPRFPDEAYMNKLYITENVLNNNDNILLEKYVTINPYIYGDFPERDNGDIHTNNFPEFDDTIFMNQKYDVSLKQEKKNNNVV